MPNRLFEEIRASTRRPGNGDRGRKFGKDLFLHHSPSRYYRSKHLLPSVLILLLLCQPAPAEPFTFEKGELPILLVAPHAGGEDLAGAAIRQKEESGDPNFSNKRDLVTLELAELYKQELHQATGKSPSVLVSHIHRKFCDLNRPEELSSPPGPGQDVHRAFHTTLRQEVDRLIEVHGRVLLLDLHGQSAQPQDLTIGVRRGEVIGEWSRVLLWGQGGLVAQLRQADFSVVPDQPEEKIRYGGGFIVKTYGAAPEVEAWQLEHGKELRFNPERNGKFVKLMAQILKRAFEQ